ncbi:uncharacterized protein LMH87_007717 [Akanthomyces muscarius]|nr:uncharacterized protein LMH87_007717 [Akanthomyces muscarius]KAJ4161694.1 hypothetical protein LMH87_007717 [Akanthomyces muscarius]
MAADIIAQRKNSNVLGFGKMLTPITWFTLLTPKLICSYNWNDSFKPRFWVPGRAPKWKQVALPRTVPPDSGRVFIDQNEARSPKYTYWPMFNAIDVINPGFSFDGIDIVVNRNSLRKLLSFCSGHRQEAFRLYLLLTKNTLFIERSEQADTEVAKPSEKRYGFSFEKAFTQQPTGAENSTGHHRVLQYLLGDLRCAVRCETDACYEMEPSQDEGIDSLLVQMGDLRLSEASPTRGMAMPQSSAAELKTARKHKSVGQFMPQLWFGRTPWLIVGEHEEGTFHSISITHAQPLFRQWEIRQQVALRKLVEVLRALREAVEKNNCKNCVALYIQKSDSKVLQVYGSTVERNPLPTLLTDK